MKKIISAICLTLALICCFSTTACGKNKTKLAIGKECVTYASQLDALNKLNQKEVNVAIIDSVMAGYYTNNGAFKDKLAIKDIGLESEEYGIAGKKGNASLMSKINEALIAIKDTDYSTISEKYGLSSEKLITSTTVNDKSSATDDSWNNLVSRGKVVIGYTLFAPIAFEDENNVLTGYDIELAKAVFNYLNTTYSTNISVEFLLIKWEAKEANLQDGTIDLVWNGLTITPQRESDMCMSLPYLRNKQVAVVNKVDENKYVSIDSMKDAIIGVEKGSAGESAVKG